jgi:hypothetical protein
VVGTTGQTARVGVGNYDEMGMDIFTTRASPSSTGLCFVCARPGHTNLVRVFLLGGSAVSTVTLFLDQHDQ